MLKKILLYLTIYTTDNYINCNEDNNNDNNLYLNEKNICYDKGIMFIRKCFGNEYDISKNNKVNRI